MGLSRALAAAVVRAGALGAAVRLTQRYVGAHAASERGRAAAAALDALTGMLFNLGRHVPEVCGIAGSALKGTGSGCTELYPKKERPREVLQRRTCWRFLALELGTVIDILYRHCPSS